MDQQLKRMIDNLGIRVIYEDHLEGDGLFIPNLKIIIINNDLNDFEKKKVLLHELGHAIEDSDTYHLYKLTSSLKSKMENSANRFMINYLICEHDGFYNYSQLLEEFKIGMGYDVEYSK